MTPFPTRLVALVVLSALGLAALGWAWEARRFGLTPAAEAGRLRGDVERRFDDARRRVDALAQRVARDSTVLRHLATDPERSDGLFARLIDLARANGALEISAAVYVPAGPAGAYRVVAWSEGPAGDLAGEALAGSGTMFVAAGPAGLRLVSAEPIESGGRRLGVAVAEVIVAPTPPGATDPPAFELESSFGPVPIVAVRARSQHALPNPFVLSSPSGQALLEVGFDADMLAEARAVFRRRVLAVSALPLVVLLLPATAAVQRRRRAAPAGVWMRWTAALSALLLGATLGLIGLARLVDARAETVRLLWSLGALALAAVVPVSAWWRRWPRHLADAAPVRFLTEQALAGIALAGLVVLVTNLLGRLIDPAVQTRWQWPMIAADASSWAGVGTTLFVELALGWTAATLLALVAFRWRLVWRRSLGWLALGIWVAPTAVLAALPEPDVPWPAVTGAGAAAAFGLFASDVRHAYRHTSQAAKLLMLFAALLLPAGAAYPLAFHSRERAIRSVIANEYAPATVNAQRADHLLTWLTAAQAEIDRLPDLVGGLISVTPGARVESQAAFRIWSQTVLSRDRVTSEIELFGPDLRLVSRFALNIPEFEAAYRTGAEIWSGKGCSWDAYAEVSRFGAEERRRLHAERGVCDASGNLNGAVVVHVLPDYRGLPFVSSANPYYDVVTKPAAAPSGSRVPDLQVVVYGWDLQPTFSSSSGRVIWPLPAEVDERLYRSREPFWAVLAAESRRYHVYFLSDRGGIYAVGYPRATPFQHLSGLSSLVGLLAGIFVLLLLGFTAYAPFSQQSRQGPLRVLFREIRTSFHRKLFLFFVLAAVGPVLLFAAAFSAYTMARFSADIRSEATAVVTVARRVFEELSAAGRHPDQGPAPVSDDVMVWIHQVIDQDVNLYEGPRLVATSQRDLFDSGLLPTRTPASVYREVALHRRPTYAAPDRIGSFQYLVAAAPVPARGKDAVLTVPLASRQREIEREVEDLNRGVLVGAVIVLLFAAGLGASVAGRVSDPVSRLTRATRLIAAGRLDVRLVADTADELGRLVEDFNAMAATLVAQRAELARTNQLKAWAEMARQVAHEIKNPLTPIQLAAEHLRHVHEDARRPLGPVFDQCLDAVLRQVRLLRQIASEFSSFGSQIVARPAVVSVLDLIDAVVDPYRPGLSGRIQIDLAAPSDLPPVWVDRTLVARALTNLVENAVQAMPGRGRLSVSAARTDAVVTIEIRDTGPGMDPEAVRRAFEPYFSTKTSGSGLGLANARRNVELSGGAIALSSTPGAGTTVTITLPRAAGDGEVGAVPPAAR